MELMAPEPTADRRGRDETRDERADRNWGELVQELRVTQTGTQILSGFLLTVAFQQSFQHLSGYQKVIYLCLIVLAAATTAVGLLPVALHRAMFRRRRKEWLVTQGNRLLVVALSLVAALTSGVVFFLFDVVVSLTAGVIAGIAAAVAMVMWLLVYPLALRRSGTAGDDEPTATQGTDRDGEPSDPPPTTRDGRPGDPRPSAAPSGNENDEERADHG
jgi:hypothetical protein